MNTISGRKLRFDGEPAAGDGPVALRLEAGRIAAVQAADAEAAASLLMPPFANAHDHARGVRPGALGAFDLPLELWLATMTGTPRCDPFLVVAAALGRQALGGCGSIMVHYTRPQEPDRVADELRIVVAAARAVGVRVAVAVALRDTNALGYAPDARILAALPGAARVAIEARLLRAPASPAAQVALADALADEFADDPLIDIQYGPYGLEWCSDALLRRVARRAADTGRRVHMHLLESPIQRAYLDHAFPGGPVSYLDSIGLLSPQLSIAHAVWLRPAEMALLAERGVTVAVNASSNLHLRNGVAPVPALHRCGVPLAMGLDGFTVDDDDDAFRELRLNALLHRGVGLEPGLPLGALFHAACHNGRRVVTGDAAEPALTAGAPADVMLLDRAALFADAVVEASDAAMIAHRGTRAMLRRLIVAGQDIVRDGRLLTLDLPAAQAALDAEVRRGADGYRAWRQVAVQWREALRGFYAAGHHCGG